MTIEHYPFVVNRSPNCVWDFDLSALNRRFLDDIDPDYFSYVGRTYSAQLDGDERQYAAIALRVAYSHGLETLFALIGAAVQAPLSIPAWLVSYQGRELDQLIRSIQDERAVLTKLPLEQVTWQSLADTFLAPDPGATDKLADLRASFAKAWSRLAVDFLDSDARQEYNSLKHALRVHMGGFRLAIGIQAQVGVAASPDQMITAAQSVFGTSLLIKDPLGDGRNFRLKQLSLNWDPRKYVKALDLIAISIANVVSYLKLANGANPDDVEFIWFSDDAAFLAPWQYDVGRSSVSMNPVIKSEFITRLSREQILSACGDPDSVTVQPCSTLPDEER